MTLIRANEEEINTKDKLLRAKVILKFWGSAYFLSQVVLAFVLLSAQGFESGAIALLVKCGLFLVIVVTCQKFDRLTFLSGPLLCFLMPVTYFVSSETTEGATVVEIIFI